MSSVDHALEQLLNAAGPIGQTETLAVTDALGRFLAGPGTAVSPSDPVRVVPFR